MDGGHDEAARLRIAIGPLECVGCGFLSQGRAWKWRGYRTDEPETRDEPEVLFYCPTCAAREFGPIESRNSCRCW
jgi:hypothetical protein